METDTTDRTGPIEPRATRPRRFVSIERKVVVPLMAVCAVVVAVLAFAHWRVLETRREELLSGEASLIARSVAHFSKDATEADMQSYLAEFTHPEKDVLVVVARGVPATVIASTYAPWCGRAVADLASASVDSESPHLSTVTQIQERITRREASPVYAVGHSCVERVALFGTDGIVVARVDSTHAFSLVKSTTVLLATLTFVGLVAVASTAVLVVRRRVVLPLAALSHHASQDFSEGESNAHTLASKTTADELTTLRDALRAGQAKLAGSLQEVERLALVARKTRNAVMITDVQRRIVWVNDAFTRMTGWRLDEVVGRVPGHFLQCANTDAASVLAIRHALRHGVPIRLELLNKGKCGREYWIDIELQPLRGPQGELTGFMAVESEITDAVVARKQLQDSAQRQRMVVACAELATWEWDCATGQLIVNDRWAASVGATLNELTPHVNTWTQFVHPEDLERTLSALNRHLTGKTELFRAEYRRIAKDGSIVWVVDAGKVSERDATGKPLRMAGINLDITEHKRAEERFELCAHGSSVGIWDWNPRTGDCYFTPRWKELLGYRDEELVNSAETWWALVHPEDGVGVKEAADEHLATRKPFLVEYRLRHKDGEYRWFRGTGQAVWGLDGKAIRMVGSLEDIHQRKLNETNRQRLASMVEHSEDAIIGLTLEGTITGCNDAAVRMFDDRGAPLIGQTEQRCIPTDEGQRERQALARIANGERVDAYESLRLRADGTRFEVSVALSAVRDETGAIVGAAKIVRDISLRREKRELQSANAMLAVQNRRLEELTERAHRFVDDVSHEFRTPLTVIKEYASLVSDGLGGPVSVQQSEWLGVIEAASVDLNQLVEDFLDSSKLRTGRLRVDRRKCTADEFVHGAEQMIARKAAARQIKVIKAIAPNLPPLFADGEKVRRVLLNLLSNALKFSPEGSTVILGAGLVGTRDIEFSVIDQGPGLVASDREQLFKRFQSLPNALAPAVKGFGLGLNIVQQLVWLNLGSVRVTSEEGRGACFSFTVPVCDAGHVVERFFERLAEREETPSSVGLLRIWARGDPARIETLRKLAVSGTRPTDVVIVASDGQSLSLFGPTECVEAWRARLAPTLVVRNRAATGEEPAVPIIAPEIEIAGSWKYPSEQAEARAAIQRSVVASVASSAAPTRASVEEPASPSTPSTSNGGGINGVGNTPENGARVRRSESE